MASWNGIRFNTPEGVEGFSSRNGAEPGGGGDGSFNTPEGVEGFSRKALPE